MPEHDTGPGQDDGRKPEPVDEEATWAAIVAAYGEEPADPPGLRPWPSVGDTPEGGRPAEAGNTQGPADAAPPGKASAEREGGGPEGGDEGGGSAARPPASGPTVPVSGTASCGWRPAELSEDELDGLDEGDEGHFVPPEPPPLPQADTTTRFAWLAVLGGPLLLFLTVLLQQEMTWWITTLGIGGFLGGFATLVIRMEDGDEEEDDPGRGAVV